MVFKAESDARVVHGQRLAKGTGFTHQHTTALAQRAIQRNDNTHAAATLGTRPMRSRAQQLRISFPLVGVADCIVWS